MSDGIKAIYERMEEDAAKAREDILKIGETIEDSIDSLKSLISRDIRLSRSEWGALERVIENLSKLIK